MRFAVKLAMVMLMVMVMMTGAADHGLQFLIAQFSHSLKILHILSPVMTAMSSAFVTQ